MVILSATEQLISRTSLTVNNRRMFCIVHHNTMQSFQHKNNHINIFHSTDALSDFAINKWLKY